MPKTNDNVIDEAMTIISDLGAYIKSPFEEVYEFINLGQKYDLYMQVIITIKKYHLKGGGVTQK